MKQQEDVHDEKCSGRSTTATQNDANVVIHKIMDENQHVIIDILMWLPPVIKLGCSSQRF